MIMYFLVSKEHTLPYSELRENFEEEFKQEEKSKIKFLL